MQQLEASVGVASPGSRASALLDRSADRTIAQGRDVAAGACRP
jgi:hypothetical protein